jgi:hypothetical protein
MKNQNKKILVLALSLLLSTPLIACQRQSNNSTNSDSTTSQGGSSVVDSDSYLRFKQSALSLEQYDVSQLSVETNLTSFLSYTSSDPKIASVSQTGRLFAKTVGNVTITVSGSSLTASTSVSVTAAPAPTLDYLKIPSKLPLSLSNRATFTLTPAYMVVDGDNETEATGKSFTYAMLDETIATVDEKGVVTAVKVGSTTLSVKSGDLTAYVEVSVFDKGIITTDDWLAMLQDLGNETTYCLINDLDFSGTTYNGYMDLQGIPDNRWTATLNGFGHHVKNITMGKTDDDHQSLFGQIMGGDIEDVAFDNVIFNGTGHDAGLAGRIFKHNNQNVVCPTTLKNISIDAIFKTGVGAGLSYDFYGGEAENIFIKMRTEDGSAFQSGSAGVFNYTTLWYGGSLKNVISYTLNSEIPAIGTEEYAAIQQSNVISSGKKMTCLYAGYSSFDPDYWTLSSTEFPILKSNS